MSQPSPLLIQFEGAQHGRGFVCRPLLWSRDSSYDPHHTSREQGFRRRKYGPESLDESEKRFLHDSAVDLSGLAE